MKNKTVRVRFAPSPTGPLHIGGLRTALYNYLFAKKNKGTFVLRIEDTDQMRFKEGAEKHILEALNWCGISPQEGPNKKGAYGPYRQSKRKHLYRKYAEKLLKEGAAYIAFDTPEDINKKRKKHEQEKKEPFQYDNKTRIKMQNALSLPKKKTEELLAQKTPYVVRIKTPKNQEIIFNDIVRGRVKINTNILDDKVLLKADGMPTYHFANVVDDFLMNISHVIRGEEWLPSTPTHLLLYEKLGWKNKTPKFAHLPLILKPKGEGKLSKRDGDKMGYSVFPVLWKEEGQKTPGFREDGFLPEAMLNILALLGWNPGTEQEIFSLKEMEKKFSLKKIAKAGARFDPTKSKWINHKHIQKEPNQNLVVVIEKHAKKEKVFKKGLAAKIIPVIKNRTETLLQLWEEAAPFYQKPTTYNLKKWKKSSHKHMKKLRAAIKKATKFDLNNNKKTITTFVKKEELSFPEVFIPLRVLLLGDTIGPDIIQTIGVLGKEETLTRMQKGLDKIKS